MKQIIERFQLIIKNPRILVGYCIVIFMIGVSCYASRMLVLLKPERIAFLFVGLLGIFVVLAIVRQPCSRWFDGLVFFLPFIQALSIKFGARWNFSEIFAWLLLFLYFLGRKLYIPNRVARFYLWMIVLFTVYQFVITPVSLLAIIPYFRQTVGLSHVALSYFYSPWARAGLELARLLACMTVVLASLTFLSTDKRFVRGLKIFAVSSMIAIAYGIYQFFGMFLGISLPLLPGTLGQEDPRIWGTFYEPKGFGYYSVIATIVMFFLRQIDSDKWYIWTMGIILGVAGVLLSVSTGAWFAGLVAAIFLFIFSGSTKRGLGVILYCLILATVVVKFSFDVLGGDFFWRNFNRPFVMARLDSHIQAIYSIPGFLYEYPLGIGLGMFGIIRSGTPSIARMSIEGGIPSLIMLIIAELCVLISITKLRRSPLRVARLFFPYAIGLHIALLLSVASYPNSTRLWLWFIMTLPVVASTLTASQKIQRAQGELNGHEKNNHKNGGNTPKEGITTKN